MNQLGEIIVSLFWLIAIILLFKGKFKFLIVDKPWKSAIRSSLFFIVLFSLVSLVAPTSDISPGDELNSGSVSFNYFWFTKKHVLVDAEIAKTRAIDSWYLPEYQWSTNLFSVVMMFVLLFLISLWIASVVETKKHG